MMKPSTGQVIDIASSVVGFCSGSAAAKAVGALLPRDSLWQQVTGTLGCFGIATVVGAFAKHETRATFTELHENVVANNVVIMPIRTP